MNLEDFTDLDKKYNLPKPETKVIVIVNPDGSTEYKVITVK